MALNTEITDVLDINQRKTTVLDGQAQITFDQDRNNRGVTQGSFKGLSLGFSPSQFTVDAPIYENVKDAYSNDEGNHQLQWKVPKDDELVSLGIVTYTNELISGKNENDFGNSRSIIGGGKLGITLNDPVDVTQKIRFPIRIHDQREGPETIALKSTNRPFKFLIRGTPIYFDYVGGKSISNATGVGTPTQYKEADPGLEDLSFNFEVQDGTTAQIELFGRFYTTKDLLDPVIITSISEDTGVAGDFRTSDNTLFINGTAEPLSEVSVFLDGNKIGTTTTSTTGNWSFDHTGTKLVDGEYELTATATDSTGNSASTNQAQPLTIDTTYDIELDFSDDSISGDKALQDRIKDAASFWENIIKNDIPDVYDSTVGDSKKGGLIDDLRITFQVKKLDNVGGSLARAYAFKTRSPNTSGGKDPLTGQLLSSFDHLPYHAVITIDEDDYNLDPNIIDKDKFLQTLQHEIAHAIGFNSKTFAKKGFVKTINQGGRTYYGLDGTKAPNALKTYKELGGKSSHESVPLEDKDNTPAHWHEWLFPDSSEISNFDKTLVKVRGGNNDFDGLMTSATPPDDKAVLSKLTLGAMEDLGFEVDYGQAGSIRIHPWQIGVPGVSSGSFLGTNQLFNIKY